MFTHLRNFILLVLASVAFNTAEAAVTANFTADVTSGCAPLVVHFTNTSTGATSYHWDLNNGTTSAQQDVSTSFSNPGTYTVKLTAYNGTDSNVKTITITAYPPPNVSFNAVDTAACPGATISFSNTTDPVSTGTTSYAWNFGDGGSSTSQDATHTFPTPGYYNITLIATNGNGCTGSLTKSNYIHIYTLASPAFTVNNTYFCQLPGQAIFTNQSTGATPISCEWEYGDGGTGTGDGPTHNYAANGTYSVTLIVTDGHGCVDSLVKPSYIHVGHTSTTFTAPASACVDQPVVFHDNSPVHISTSWTFGDGGTSTLDTPVHVFTAPGTYSVQMVVFDGHCYDTVTNSIVINPGSTGSFTFTPNPPCPAPFTLQFNGTAPSGSTFEWLFGDGGTGTTATPSHTYQHNGADTIRMIITNSLGCKDTVAQIDTFYNLLVGLLGSVNGGCVPFTVNFSTFHLTNEPDTLFSHQYPYPVTYSWNFGDGSAPVTDSAPSHTFTTPGTYTVTITETSIYGCTATTSAQIHAGTPPVASFTYTPNPGHICADRTIDFTNTSTGATNYVWDFGDQDGSGDMSPSHQYILPGTFTVTLIAYNNGCPDTDKMVDIISVDSPKAIFFMGFGCSPRTQVSFTDSSLGATTFLWIFGDGDTSTELNPVHNYPSINDYTVELTTYNAASGCRDTSAVPFTLVLPQVSFSADDTAVCKNAIVHFTPVITGGFADDYLWYVNNIYQDSFTHHVDTFTSTGIYSVMMILKDNFGCYDTVIKNNYVLVAQPVDSFTVTPATGCWPLTVQFNDYSTDVPGTTLTSWQWAFGDGSSATINSTTTSHLYTQVGPANVTEIITDNLGCKDTLVKPALIHVNRPAASFYASVQSPCAGASVHFTNITQGSLQSSYWIFGDGSTSSVTSPDHIYTQSGIYTVLLIVTDINGCTDTATYANYISVSKPHASFTLSDSFTVCPPLLENFTNTSTGATSYLWLFGNNNSSTGANPSNDYTASGYYTVLLIAKDVHGCPDTAVAHVSIYGYSGAFNYGPTEGCSPLTVAFSANISQVPTVIWDFSDGNTLTTTNGDTITHIYTIPGAYVPKLILSNNAGCQNSSTGLDTIKIDGIKPGYITGPVCLNETVNFQDTSYGYFSPITSWLWTFNNTGTSTLQDPTYVYNAIGTYPVALVVTDANGCMDSTSGTVTVHNLPTITAIGDTTVCAGDAAQISGAGGVSYSWSPSASVNCVACQVTNASPTVSTVYTVTGTDQTGCSNTDSVTVNVKTLTISVAGASTAICRGDTINITDSGAQTYTWYPAVNIKNDNTGSPTVYPTTTTTYMVVAQDGSCIPDTNYVTVTVHPLPSVTTGSDQTIVAGSSTRLEATSPDATRYLWTPGATLDCDSCSNPTATPVSTTTYTITAFSEYDCEDSAHTTIHVVCDNSQVFIPNSFTPNGDGQNDVFYPRGTGISTIKSFRVYNRWGEVLFERTDININDAASAWDGTYKGGTPRPDVYVYVIDAICNTGEPMTLKGDVTIIR